MIKRILGVAVVCAIFIACGLAERRYKVDVTVTDYVHHTCISEDANGNEYKFDAEGIGIGSELTLYVDTNGTHGFLGDDYIIEVTPRN